MTPAQYRQTRIRCGLTQQQLAEALGVSRLTVIRRERGQTPITREIELAILQVEALPELAIRALKVKQ